MVAHLMRCSSLLTRGEVPVHVGPEQILFESFPGLAELHEHVGCLLQIVSGDLDWLKEQV